MTDLGSAPIPAIGPDDHCTGEEGADRVCRPGLPALRWCLGDDCVNAPGRLVFRHFPVKSKHPRSPLLHAAAEAAGRQGSLYAIIETRSTPTAGGSTTLICGRGRRISGSTSTASRPTGAQRWSRRRVRQDFESGIRAGVGSTPALFGERGERLPSAFA